MKDVKFFFLGSLYAYTASFTKAKPYMHVISLISLFIFTSQILLKESATFLELDLHEKLVLLFLAALEYKILHFLQFKFVMKVGGLFCILGYLISFYSMYHLKQNKHKGTVFTGPYKYARHPFYCGIALFLLGSVLYLHVFGTLIYVVFIYKKRFDDMIENEELELLKRDEKYRKYKQTVSRFFVS